MGSFPISTETSNLMNNHPRLHWNSYSSCFFISVSIFIRNIAATFFPMHSNLLKQSSSISMGYFYLSIWYRFQLSSESPHFEYWLSHFFFVKKYRRLCSSYRAYIIQFIKLAHHKNEKHPHFLDFPFFGFYFPPSCIFGSSPLSFSTSFGNSISKTSITASHRGIEFPSSSSSSFPSFD